MVKPSFGTKEKDVTYETRIGVYVVIYNETTKEIILVQAPNGAYFLPGGEIETGETKEVALKRELLEELGFSIENPTYFGEADEYFFSRHRNTHYYNPGYFYGTSCYHKLAKPLEDFNHLKWFPIEEGMKQLKRGSHQWAVAEFIKKKL